jgi:hypothetical protein
VGFLSGLEHSSSVPLLDAAEDEGAEFPLSVETPNAHFPGLSWAPSGRAGARIGLCLRAEALVFRMFKGTGEIGAWERGLRALSRPCGAIDEGESGELGEGDADLDVTSRNVGPFDGDLESDRRS